MAFSMEGCEGQAPTSLIHEYWSPNWNSVQSLNKFQEEIGGPLRGGDPGKKLIEVSEDSQFEYFKQIPAQFEARKGELFILPAYHIFGSEELSVNAPGIGQLCPKPYIMLNIEDAKNFKKEEGDLLEIKLTDKAVRLPVKLTGAISKGMAMIPAGLPDLKWDGVPVRVKIGNS
jgi:NADH-quinone oxidoreductase subunit G